MVRMTGEIIEKMQSEAPRIKASSESIAASSAAQAQDVADVSTAVTTLEAHTQSNVEVAARGAA